MKAALSIILSLTLVSCTKGSSGSRSKVIGSKAALLSTPSSGTTATSGSTSTVTLSGGSAGGTTELNMANCDVSEEEQAILLRDYPGMACGAPKACPMPSNPTPFISVWRTTEPNETLVLPLNNSFRYDFTVDWGDGTTGTVRSHDSPEARHVFKAAGDHVIQWKGCAEGISLASVQESAPKLIQVLDLGRMGWRNFHGAFMGAENLVSVAGGDTSQVVDMTWMFNGAGNLMVLGASHWNTSKVTRMARMFEDVANLTRLEIGDWDTSNVKDFSGMFNSMTNLETLNISNWDTSSAEAMMYMFAGAESLRRLDLSHFNTANVAEMSGMFTAAAGLAELNLKNWELNPILFAREIFEGTDPNLLIRCDPARGGIILGRPCVP